MAGVAENRFAPNAHDRPRRSAPSVPFSVLLFIVDGFSMMALCSVVEPLRAANRLVGDSRYTWALAAERAGAIPCSNGIEITARYDIRTAPRADLTVVVASLFDRPYPHGQLANWLRRLRVEGRMIGGVSNGTLLLADAGVVGDRKVSVHWEAARELALSHPEITVTDSLYNWDRGILTAAGGTAGMDMILALIAEIDGEDLAVDIADQFLHGPIRSGSEMQRTGMQWRHRLTDPRMVLALDLMKSNLSDPIRIPAIAERAGVSERQLERLFQSELGMGPSDFYLDVRLRAARGMLIATTETLESIAETTGFSSLGHFSRAFKTRFGESPSVVRRRRPREFVGWMQENGGTT